MTLSAAPMEPAVTYQKRSRPHRRIEPSWRPLYYFRCGGSPRRRRRSARRPRRGRQGANRAGKKGKKYYQSLQITKSIAATQSRSNVHKRTQGWTVLHLPSTPGRCSLCRPPLGPAMSPNAAAFRVPAASCALGVVPLPHAQSTYVCATALAGRRCDSSTAFAVRPMAC